MKIAVFGLGYVGTVTAASLAARGHDVVGVDTSTTKVDDINHGISPIVEDGLCEMVRAETSTGRLRATTDHHEAFEHGDAAIVCIGTPPLDCGGLDVRPLESFCRDVSSLLEGGACMRAIVIRSTILPGTMRRLYRDHFERFQGRGLPELVYHPEFLREGSALADFAEPPLCIAGSIDGDPASCPAELVGAPSWQTWEYAELMKHACNYWHALKVAFANEIGRLGKSVATDTIRMMEEFVMDTKLNVSGRYLTPGLPFGGSCLPKDVAALQGFARAQGLALPVLEHVLPSNDVHMEHVIRTTTAVAARRVLLIGLTFKPGTDDVRGSPLLTLAEALLDRGHAVDIYEPLLLVGRLVGANLREIHGRIPHLSRLLVEDVAAAVTRVDVVVVGRKDGLDASLFADLDPATVVVDLVGWPDLAGLRCRVEGLCR